MPDPSPPDVTESPRAASSMSGSLPLIILIAAVLFFAWRAYDLMVPSYYALADEHGYLTTAKRLATTGSFAQHQPDPYAFIGETMMQSARDPTTYYLRQPIGYPILCAIAYMAGGDDGPFAVNPLLGVALLVGIYFVGKELGSRLLGAVAALLIATHPLVLYYTVMALSHIPDMAAATWVIALALMWRRERQIWQAILVGLLFGAAILIRYTNVLLCIPLLVILIPEMRGERRGVAFRAAGFAAAAAALALVPLALYQAAAFGSVFRTGYSAGGNGTSFSLGWLLEHAPVMGNILLRQGIGLGTLLIGMIAGIAILIRKNRFVLALLLAWAVPPLVLYTAYYGIPGNTILYARFALSSFVPLVLLAIFWAASLPNNRIAIVSVIALTVVTIALNVFNPYMSTSLTNLDNEMYLAFSTRDLVRSNVPAGSMIVADDYTHYFLDYLDHYTIYDPDIFEAKPLARRLADLQRVPHESDPARTRQLAELLGGKSEEELWAVLRTQIVRYQRSGHSVYLVALVKAAGAWQKHVGLPMKVIDTSNLTVGIYEFEPTPGPGAP